MRIASFTLLLLLLSQVSAETSVEAYRVNIASHQNGLYTLTDGSVVARDVWMMCVISPETSKRFFIKTIRVGACVWIMPIMQLSSFVSSADMMHIL